MRRAGFSQDTSASPRALIVHPNPEHRPHELQAGLPSKGRELTAASPHGSARSRRPEQAAGAYSRHLLLCSDIDSSYVYQEAGFFSKLETQWGLSEQRSRQWKMFIV